MVFKIISIAIIFFSFHSAQAQNINDNLSSISESIISQLKNNDIKSIAIVDFSNLNGQVSELGKSLSNKLRINISKKTSDIKIVNRSILKKALEEEQLFKDGVIDPMSAKKIKFVGIEAIVLGEISDYGNNYSIELQIIDTETSDIIGGEILDAPQTESFKDLYESILYDIDSNDIKNSNEKNGSPESQQKANRSKYDNKEMSSAQRGTINSMELVLENCFSSEEGVSCTFELINRTDKANSLRLNPSSSRIFNCKGEEVKSNWASIGNKGNSKYYVVNEIPSDTKTKIQLSFTNDKSDCDIIQNVEVAFKSKKVNFKKVPVSKK